MADELTVNISAQLLNGNLDRAFTKTGLQFTQDAQGANGVVVSIGSGAEEDIVHAEIGTLGWCFLFNLDDTNFVTYGPNSAGSMVPFGRIEAGEPAAFRLEPGITIRAQADTAAVELDVLILED